MIGVEFSGEAGPVLKGLARTDVLATKAGDKVLRLLPPLVIGTQGDSRVPGRPRGRPGRGRGNVCKEGE